MKFIKYDNISKVTSDDKVAGNIISIRKGTVGNYYWNLYKISTDLNLSFIRGITDDQQYRLEQLDQSLIDKLSQGYSKAAIDSLFNSLSSGTKNVIASDSPVTGVDVYNANSTGTYTNFGNILVDNTDINSGQVQLRRSIGGSGWSKIIIPIDVTKIRDIENNTFKRNLLNNIPITSGKYVDGGDGLLYTVAGFNATDYINIKPNQQYIFTETDDQNFAYYDKNKVYITGFGGYGKAIITTPSNAFFIRITISNPFIATQTFFEYNPNLDIKTFNKDNLYTYFTDTLNKYIDNTTGNLLTSAGFRASDFVPVVAGEKYEFSDSANQYFAYYDKNKTFIKGYAGYVGGTIFLKSIIIPSGVAYIRYTTTDAEAGNFYFKRAYSKDIETIEIHVGISGSFPFVGKNAIKNAINSIFDASYYKRYVIVITEGIYEASVVGDFNQYFNQAFIAGKNFISIRGVNRDKVIIKAELPDNLGPGFNYGNYQPLYWHSNFGTVEDLTITAKNMRYCVHIDDVPNGCKDFYSKFKNVKLIHQGNYNNATNWGSPYPIGMGTSDGQVVEFQDVEFSSKDISFSSHTGPTYNKPSKVICNRCSFITTNGDINSLNIRLTSSGSRVNDTVEFIDCNFSNPVICAMDYTDLRTNIATASYNHMDLKILGHGNSPIYYSPTFGGGDALRIISNNLTSGSVRFDNSYSAFDVLIKDQYYIGGVNYKDTGDVETEGYSFKDGASGIKGFAIGRLDLSGTFIATTAMGKRLGNCLSVNKQLKVTIDGVVFIITFNKDYTAFSNAAIIAEINAVIASKGVADLYSVAYDYYPEFTDVLFKEVASGVIFNGDVVVKQAGKIRRATVSDTEIYGVAIDDILIGNVGRVVKNTLLAGIPSPTTARFYVNSEVVTFGAKLGIISDGKLGVGATLKPFTCIENGVIKIN